MAGWPAEPGLQDEGRWTPAGEGWRSWNRMSAEVEWCEFVAALATLLRPHLVVETGVGQGFTTRRLLPALAGNYTGYESDPEWREKLRDLDVWTPSHRLVSDPTPPPAAFAEADLTILDSDPPCRVPEMRKWLANAGSGAYVLVHDVRPDHPRNGLHRRLAREVPRGGLFLHHPRGSWLYQKP